jgi:hypothetical protein
MKNTRYFLAALVVGLLVSASAYADSGATRFTIPFNFYLGDNSLSPGEYLVSMATQRTLKMERVDGKDSVLVNVNPVEDPLGNGRARIVFHRYGDAYFCAVVWAPTRSAGYELFATGRELQVAREMPQKAVMILANK